MPAAEPLTDHRRYRRHGNVHPGLVECGHGPFTPKPARYQKIPTCTALQQSRLKPLLISRMHARVSKPILSPMTHPPHSNFHTLTGLEEHEGSSPMLSLDVRAIGVTIDTFTVSRSGSCSVTFAANVSANTSTTLSTNVGWLTAEPLPKKKMAWGPKLSTMYAAESTKNLLTELYRF